MKKQLVFDSIEFYSTHDESALFEWIAKIDDVLSFRGEGTRLILEVSFPVEDASLRELLALSFRYAGDMKQFAVFLNDSNKNWFFDRKKTYWYKGVFKNRKTVDTHSDLQKKTKGTPTNPT